MTTLRLALVAPLLLGLVGQVAHADPDGEPAAPLAAFLETRVPEELAAEGLMLSRRGLTLQIEPVGDKLLVSLIDRVTGRVVASTKIDQPPRDREAAVASVTQVAAGLVTQYSGTPTATQPAAPASGSTPAPIAATPIAPSPSPSPRRTGLTFEADLGMGLHALSGTTTGPSAAVGLSLGTWIVPRRAVLALRVGLVGVSANGTNDNRTFLFSAFVGPSLQYWVDDHLWFSGGVGFAAFGGSKYDSYAGVTSIFGLRSACNPPGSPTGPEPVCDIYGGGFDLRAGYSFGPTSHQVNVAVEAIPARYGTDPGKALFGGDPGHGGSALTFALTVGYQFL